ECGTRGNLQSENPPMRTVHPKGWRAASRFCALLLIFGECGNTPREAGEPRSGERTKFVPAHDARPRAASALGEPTFDPRRPKKWAASSPIFSGDRPRPKAGLGRTLGGEAPHPRRLS